MLQIYKYSIKKQKNNEYKCLFVNKLNGAINVNIWLIFINIYLGESLNFDIGINNFAKSAFNYECKICTV